MGLLNSIPLPTGGNEAFKDVMDYFEEIQKRKAMQAKATQENQMEQQKLNSLNEYRQSQLAQSAGMKPLQMELLRARIADLKNKKAEVKETPEEKAQREVDIYTKKEGAKEGIKIKTSARNLKEMTDRALKLRKLIKENPGLTGWLPGLKASMNISRNPKLGEFQQTATKLQADMGRYGSTRGGAQALKWAERAKPSNYKDTGFNLGMINSILEDANADYKELGKEHEDYTGKSLGIEFPNTSETTLMYKKGKKYNIPTDQIEDAKTKGYSENE